MYIYTYKETEPLEPKEKLISSDLSQIRYLCVFEDRKGKLYYK